MEPCLFHGKKDCPAAEELDSLDDQIEKRLKAEAERNDFACALRCLLDAVEDDRAGRAMSKRLMCTDRAIKLAQDTLDKYKD